MSSTPLLLCDGHNLLYRACFGTPAQIWSRDPHDKRELTTEFMFFGGILAASDRRYRLARRAQESVPAGAAAV